ncbi:LamB/YcsF family protein [Microbacterium excoecariae]|uniref:LamB/YcsF family protein n=1 Tax=Microbacterium excoecariae TaxID=2715210 RepID=UPI001408D2AE|nr:5-oxoprolinase subunit PxpA [Microbacterium excoecariae]NHI17373.1 LamB/YcsF family protein [Microbacterium excoecariae]
MRAAIDLNSDVGESFGAWTLGDDAAMLDVVTSANVACGFHGGDPTVIARTCRRAVDRGVAIGAHVGYRDLAGFGRRFVDYTESELADDIVYQMGALQALARRAGGAVSYVKPHGALYNAIVTHEAHARAVIAAVAAVDDALPVLLLPGSVALEVAERRGLRGVREAFADRAYAPDGSLVPRSAEGAVLHDPAEVASRVVRLCEKGSVLAIDGSVVPVPADSVCLHGDTPGAVELARAVRAGLERTGVEIASFA